MSRILPALISVGASEIDGADGAELASIDAHGAEVYAEAGRALSAMAAAIPAGEGGCRKCEVVVEFEDGVSLRIPLDVRHPSRQDAAELDVGAAAAEFVRFVVEDDGEFGRPRPDEAAEWTAFREARALTAEEVGDALAARAPRPS